MTTQKDYNENEVKAARSVLIEAMHILGAYQDKIVLIGGWVPEVLFSDKDVPHVGSTDVDLAVDHLRLGAAEYDTIKKLLLKRGYRPGNQPFIFFREVKIGDQTYEVQLDLLAGEYEGTGKKHRHQRIQDGHARKARGCDLAFSRPVTKVINGQLPDGSMDSVDVRICAVIPFLAMKGITMDQRLKEKDAYDIYYSIRYYPGGIEKLVEEFKEYKKQGLIIEGFQKMAKHFDTVENIGSRYASIFPLNLSQEERDQLQQDAFQRVNELLKRIKII